VHPVAAFSSSRKQRNWKSFLDFDIEGGRHIAHDRIEATKHDKFDDAGIAVCIDEALLHICRDRSFIDDRIDRLERRARRIGKGIGHLADRHGVDHVLKNPGQFRRTLVMGPFVAVAICPMHAFGPYTTCYNRCRFFWAPWLFFTRKVVRWSVVWPQS
jgi:hypothetical protein